MNMPVAVRAARHRVVRVVVMAVVVPVRMLVVQHLVCMDMPVRLGQMQHHAKHHQQASGRHDPTAAAVAQRDRDRGPDERREGEHRARARGTERPLREQIEAQAKSVARRADHEQTDRCAERGQRIAEEAGDPALRLLAVLLATSAMPPASRSSMAAQTRRSMVSP